MLRSTESIINQGLHHHIIRDSDLAHLFKGSDARRYGLVNKALKKGELVRLCRGHYTLANKYVQQPFSSIYLANRLVAHSFVSAESALSFHGWIPEQVTQTVSICAFGREREFETPVGNFIYYPLPVPDNHFFDGVELTEIQSKSVYIASPLRAILDLVYLHKIKNADTDFLIHSLRIDEEKVFSLTKNEIKNLSLTYSSARVKKLLSNLLKEIHHE